MKRIAFKFGYLGTAFQGSQRQTGTALRTVEGEILKALRGIGGISGPEVGFKSAGRTDREVSALANCCVFSCPLEPGDVMRMLNAGIEGVLFHSHAEVTDDFNPRHAAYRHYRYHFPPSFRESLSTDAPRAFLHKIIGALDIFRGEHDFRNFARMEEGRNPIRRIRRISGGIHGPRAEGKGNVRERSICEGSTSEASSCEGVIFEGSICEGSDCGGTVYVDIVGESFLWNQVRRMVGAAASVCAGKLDMEELTAALAGTWKSGDTKHGSAAASPSNDQIFPILPNLKRILHMPPRYLVLMDVHYEHISFTTPCEMNFPLWFTDRQDFCHFETIFLDYFKHSQ